MVLDGDRRLYYERPVKRALSSEAARHFVMNNEFSD